MLDQVAAASTRIAASNGAVDQLGEVLLNFAAGNARECRHRVFAYVALSFEGHQRIFGRCQREVCVRFERAISASQAVEWTIRCSPNSAGFALMPGHAAERTDLRIDGRLGQRFGEIVNLR